MSNSVVLRLHESEEVYNIIRKFAQECGKLGIITELEADGLTVYNLEDYPNQWQCMTDGKTVGIRNRAYANNDVFFSAPYGVLRTNKDLYRIPEHITKPLKPLIVPQNAYVQEAYSLLSELNHIAMKVAKFKTMERPACLTANDMVHLRADFEEVASRVSKYCREDYNWIPSSFTPRFCTALGADWLKAEDVVALCSNEYDAILEYKNHSRAWGTNAETRNDLEEYVWTK